MHTLLEGRTLARDIIILAAHDDGSGAHVTMSHICRGLLSAVKKREDPPLVLYLNSSNYGLKWAQQLWFSTSRKSKWVRRKSLNAWPPVPELEAKDGVWLCMDNTVRLSKAADGALDVPATREMLATCQASFEHWPYQITKVPLNRVVLAIEMGVPQLSKWAKENGIPAIAVGDMFWSRTLMGSLEGAGEFDREVEEAVRMIAECERCASEVWRLPIVSARDYADYFGQVHIPVLTLPGFFGPKGIATKANGIREELNMESEKLVVMGAGTTHVWSQIYADLDELVRKEVGKEFALLCPRAGRQPMALVDNGNRKDVQQRTGMMPFFLHADLGVTRGGITMVEFISAELPFIVVQEPNHWLSRKQQAQAREAGLCHSACLSRLKDGEQALSLIRQCLRAKQNMAMKARMTTFRFGIETEWAEYVLRHHARRLR